MYLSFGRAFFRDKKRSFLEEEIVDSSYVSEFKTNLANNLSINSSLEIDKKFKKLLTGSFGMTYSKEIRKKIELRSIFKRNPKYLSEHFRTNVGSMINEIELISKWDRDKIINAYLEAPRKGFNTQLMGKDLLYWASTLLDLSKKGLEKRDILNNKKRNETLFLTHLQKLIDNKTTNADHMTNKFSKSEDLNVLYDK